MDGNDFFAAIQALHEHLGTESNTLVDLRCIDEKMAEEMEDRYAERYTKATDGGPTQITFEDVVRISTDDERPETKGDVLIAWESELRDTFPRAFMKGYTRNEAVTMLNLLNKQHMEYDLRLQFSPGFHANLYGLAEAWNDMHPGENPIKFSGYGDYLP